MKQALLITLLYFSPLLWTCLFNQGVGNVYASQQKLDSLNKELQKHQANDIQKLKIYNKLAWYYQYVQIDSSLGYAKKAIALAKDIENLEGLTEAYNISGLILSRTGNNDAAISEINKSIELNNNVSQQNLAFSHALLLGIKGNYGNDSLLKSEYSKAFAIYSKLQDETGIAILNTNYCAYLRSFDLNKALEYNRKALAGFSKTREDEWLAYSYAMQAGIFNLNSQYDSALFYTQKSEEINNRLGLPINQINIYGIRSLIYQYQANYPLAIKNYLMAIRYCEKGGDLNSLDYCLNNIAWCYNEIGDFEKSLHYLKLQLPIAQSRNDLYTLSGCYQEFGNVYLKQKNFKKARIEYSKAMDASLKMNRKDRIGECHRMLGDAHNGLHRYDSALYHYGKAIKINKEIGSQWEYCKTLISVAQTLNEIPDQSFKGELPMRLSTDLNTDRGISYALEALEIVLKTGELDLQRDAYKVLSDLYESKNEIKKSFGYYKKYNAINDSIKNTENKSQLPTCKCNTTPKNKNSKSPCSTKTKNFNKRKLKNKKQQEMP